MENSHINVDPIEVLTALVGGVQAGTDHWRTLFWIVAGLGGLEFLFALLTDEDAPAQDRSAPWAVLAKVLAAAARPPRASAPLSWTPTLCSR